MPWRITTHQAQGDSPRQRRTRFPYPLQRTTPHVRRTMTDGKLISCRRAVCPRLYVRHTRCIAIMFARPRTHSPDGTLRICSPAHASARSEHSQRPSQYLPSGRYHHLAAGDLSAQDSGRNPLLGPILIHQAPVRQHLLPICDRKNLPLLPRLTLPSAA